MGINIDIVVVVVIMIINFPGSTQTFLPFAIENRVCRTFQLSHLIILLLLTCYLLVLFLLIGITDLMNDKTVVVWLYNFYWSYKHLILYCYLVQWLLSIISFDYFYIILLILYYGLAFWYFGRLVILGDFGSDGYCLSICCIL